MQLSSVKRQSGQKMPPSRSTHTPRLKPQQQVASCCQTQANIAPSLYALSIIAFTLEVPHMSRTDQTQVPRAALTSQMCVDVEVDGRHSVQDLLDSIGETARYQPLVLLRSQGRIVRPEQTITDALLEEIRLKTAWAKMQNSVGDPEGNKLMILYRSQCAKLPATRQYSARLLSI